MLCNMWVGTVRITEENNNKRAKSVMAFDAGGASSLEQFTLLARNARGRACVALIQQVLSNKKLFVFRELLDMPNVQALQGTEYQGYFDLLQIFCFGTYGDYIGACVGNGAVLKWRCIGKNEAVGFTRVLLAWTARKDQLPELTTPQVQKLRKLTAVSLTHEYKVRSYARASPASS